MKKLLILFFGLLLLVSCRTEDENEVTQINIDYVYGNWSGMLSSDKFCSGNGGSWSFTINSSGNIQNGKFTISGVDYTLNGTIDQKGELYTNVKGSYVKDNVTYVFSGTINKSQNQLLGSWSDGGPEDNCFKGNKN